jgi:deoxyribonuclease V
VLAAVDAQYSDEVAAASCVTFATWTDPTPASEHSTLVHGVEPYEPGEFWRRELPCIIAVLGQLQKPPEVVVIDGYVWLDDKGRKGLGAHLAEALAGPAVIGIAKHPFAGASNATLVQRGKSLRPLHVTAQGISLDDAAAAVRSMHGAHRIPTLIRRVDELCRQALADADA